MARALLAIVTLFVGCSAGSPPHPSREPSSVTPATSTAPVDAPAPAEASAGSPRAEPSPTAASLPFAFERVEPTQVTSLGLGKPPKVAFLARGEALLFDGKGFARLPAPDTRDTTLSVEIFFGRDDQPRLMGFRRAAEGSSVSPYYRRYKAGRFQPEPSELGPLSAPDGALYGVLGHDDPEVVCRPRAFCLVKRTTGWGRAPAHAEPVRVVLAAGTAFALHPDHVERLERDVWVPLVPERPFAAPRSLFLDASGSPWIVHGNEVTRLVGGRWESMPSPVGEPRAIWGTVASDVWLVGALGAAHFDGKSWRRAADVTGPLSLVARSGPSLWLAGEAGVFRGTETRAE